LLFPEIFAKPIRMEFDQREGSSDGGAVSRKQNSVPGLTRAWICGFPVSACLGGSFRI
jgi:hypothetical protein